MPEYTFIPNCEPDELAAVFGESKPRRPFSYLVTPDKGLIPARCGGHSTEMLRNPVLQRLIPWYEEAARIVDDYIRRGPNRLFPQSYAHRVALTNPLDDLLFDAFYEFGGNRLFCHAPYVTPAAWELTGRNPQPLVEGLKLWLETSQPYAEDDAPLGPVELSVCRVAENPKARVLPEILRTLP